MNTDTDTGTKNQPAPVKKPTSRFMLAHPAHLIAQGFGSGLSPVVPGTMGTLFGWLSFYALSQRWPALLTTEHWLLIVLTGFIVGIYVCAVTGRHLGTSDHGSMVWDEIVAIWLVLAVIGPVSMREQTGAFLLFRFFDMVKPPPIRAVDRRFKGGFGVMADDIVAAFFTLLTIALWRLL